MLDPISGQTKFVCDCGQDDCLHRMLVETYHSRISEPIYVKDAEAYLLCGQIPGLNVKYVFSVASASGSFVHQTPKRTIVKVSESRVWTCKACSKR